MVRSHPQYIEYEVSIDSKVVYLWFTKINWLRGVILLNPIVLVPWGKFSLCHTPIRSISAFRDQISILIVGCVTTWSRGSHQLVSELGSETRSYPSVIFVFFSVPLSLSVFASIFLFFVSTSSKQKKKFYISSCYCL